MSATNLTAKIKQTYFFLDYLRMHSNGRELQLFKKNRAMLVPAEADDTKKGYKAFIQRIFRTLLDNEFANYLEIVKPREVFGYNMGPRDEDLLANGPQASQYRAIDIFDNNFGKLLYIYRRNLLYGEYRSYLTRYVDIVNRLSTLEFRGRKFFFKIRLDENQSKGWETIQALREIKNIHNEMIETINPENEIKKTFKTFIDRILKVQEGQNLFRFEQNIHAIDPGRRYRVIQVSETTDTTGHITAVSILGQKINSEGRDVGRQERLNRTDTIPEYSENNAEVAARLSALSALIGSFKETWLEIALGASNDFDLMMLLPLAMNSFVRNLPPEEETFIRRLDFYGEHAYIFQDVERTYIDRRRENESRTSNNRRRANVNTDSATIGDEHNINF